MVTSTGAGTLGRPWLPLVQVGSAPTAREADAIRHAMRIDAIVQDDALPATAAPRSIPVQANLPPAPAPSHPMSSAMQAASHAALDWGYPYNPNVLTWVQPFNPYRTLWPEAVGASRQQEAVQSAPSSRAAVPTREMAPPGREREVHRPRRLANEQYRCPLCLKACGTAERYQVHIKRHSLDSRM